MDNCAFTAETTECLTWMYSKVGGIFRPYKFHLQQFLTNDPSLQDLIDKEHEIETPPNTKLLGLQQSRHSDTLSTKPLSLNANTSSKRQILSSIASQFDLLNFNGPLMNRARLFLNKLQDGNLSSDEALEANLMNEWKNICKQANSAPPIEFPRNFGCRTDHYKLIGFADSSRVMFGAVIYLLNMDSNKSYFILARNTLVNK